MPVMSSRPSAFPADPRIETPFPGRLKLGSGLEICRPLDEEERHPVLVQIADLRAA